MIDNTIVIPENTSVRIYKRKWIRAKVAGLFNAIIKNGEKVKKGQVLGHIMDTYGATNFAVKAPKDGYIIAKNNFPIINMGDALFHFGS